MHAIELRMLYNSKNYEEIYDRIRQEMEKLALGDRLCTNDLEGLQSSVEEEMRRCIHEQRGIPRPLINIILLQGEVFEKRMRSLASSYLGSLCSVNYQEFLNCNFQKLSSLDSCLSWIEESIAKISLRYSHIPDDWCLSQEILLKYYFMTKQRACDYFFYNEVDEEDFMEAFNSTIKHEKRLGRLFEKHGCCACALYAPSVDSHQEALCPHRTMVSSLFIPNIEIYLRRSFSFLMQPDLNQEDTRACVVSRFLDFFRGVGKILKRVEYLNDKSVYRHLVHYFDEHLSLLMKRINSSKDLYGSIIVLNTLLFIRETALDFLDQIIEKSGVEEDIPKIHMEIRRVERSQNAFIDDFLSNYFSGLDFAAPEGLSREIIQFLDKSIMNERTKGIHEDVQITLLEDIISHAFSRIYTTRVSPQISESLLFEISEIKRYLRTKVSVVPLMDVVEKYLKIFLCPLDNKECFVKNFILMSEGIFSFDQIVNSIGNEHEVGALYSAYEAAMKSLHPLALETPLHQ
ncbi:hypothetical protein EROM_101080 [Encephalitozoon romaleae SJ-2008]|uniref:Uncharacterized protein n=1 Tax=Encephalitozoon romaleae (strain SJ-2008) TaxID=1178016 RepID=I6ZKT1_ENCRO|nr:hypothetical protein EROM_101080 [Encephalitozoon romaleae SJ-2008]AFN83923.1 hypothetical protein EROM_101080 [Encephalitozoon romaleae SJ-2008]